MTTTAQVSAMLAIDRAAKAAGRDSGIDTMRGIAILMVIGIHSLHQPLTPAWETWLDAALRPCVPIFLFVSGYLTAQSGRVPLARRFKAILVPYAIAFVAAYLYMALHNPAMDHRPVATVARFLLAYVFVYYYVFVYAGCTVLLWLVFRPRSEDEPRTDQQLAVILLLAIAIGLIAGSYLDPLLFHFGASPSLVEEFRMRDIPFWFCFAALGALVGLPGVRTNVQQIRRPLIAVAFVLYVIYAAIRQFQIGDAADYDSVAFFGYAALLCIVLLALNIRHRQLVTLGSGSYFIYLWHIFIVMLLRDHTGLRQLGPVADTAVTFTATAALSVIGLLAVRRFIPSRFAHWLGA
ncbi:acyltransferase family protein [Rhodopseudomonas sp. P2A-2r]|uniref:acyltransferase family protein n=1 Tax=unclassified Rhodopseudomonas TaxID=2638247 RepID=UPI002234BC92|nr:acyltransferase [Rhodopseudomonas sp. P2A-2r]UZE47494.1 acyltransferase [Rhodopseudomonas sp. P2A-2r]